MIRLYDTEFSAECYKARLLLALLGVEHELVPVDIHPGHDHEQEDFLALNPLGEVPVLGAGDLTLRSANAILIWIAGLFDAEGHWLPKDADGAALCQGWLGMAERLAASAGRARMTLARGEALPDSRWTDEAQRLLRAVDEHLWFAEQAEQNWLVPGPCPTIADIACFPDIALCEEAGVSRINYPAIRRWMDRVRRIDGFVLMSGVFAASRAAAQPRPEATRPQLPHGASRTEHA